MDFYKQWEQEKERVETIKSRVIELTPYMRHSDDCATNEFTFLVSLECTCGLDAVYLSIAKA